MADFAKALDAALAGGPQRHHEKTAEQGKMAVRERVARLVDEGSFSEEGLLANWQEEGLGADGVVTGLAVIGGRRVALMANDPTVKAGSWGPKTVEKILRVQERALKLQMPMVYLVDSAGARITEQVQMFPGRRGAGRIFHNEVRLSGQVPQVCLLFGPSAAGGAYIPAFCDVVIMRDGNASMYLGSPRMAEMVIGEKVTLEEMGGARMHTGVSGCGHFLVKSDEEAIDLAKRYLSFMPGNWSEAPPTAPPGDPASSAAIDSIVPADENQPFDMREVMDALLDADSFLEIHRRWAKELIVGFGRLDGEVVGVVANQPAQKGGVLFVDSADKAARFIQTCNAFNVPLLFLADVPGFMIGTAVERQGIIRHGAKMISAVSEATVPKLSVIVRKAYGAGLYAMAGPAFEPDCCIALPSASIAVMGPQAAVNAVFYNQIQEIADEAERERFVAAKREEYAADIDILHLASELVVDAVVQPQDLRGELIRRFDAARRQGPRLRRTTQPGHAGLGRMAGGAPSIVAESLEVWRGGAEVLHGLSFPVEGGRVTGLLGPSGCGKTTLMRAIVGVQVVESGRVDVLGEPAGSPQLRSRVGYLTQAPSVYGDLTVRENLRFFGRVLGVPQGREREVIETVALEPHADRVVSRLSGGQQARVSLATALLGEPEVLVLDEPTVGLDPVLRRDLWSTFARLAAAGTTLLVSSHVMEEAEHCDELLLMRDGRLLAVDSPDGLRRRTGRERLDEAFLALIEAGEGA